jgi:hypothetical protein
MTMNDQPVRVVVDIEEGPYGERVANPRLSGCTYEEAAAALRAAADLLVPPTPEDTNRTWIERAIEVIAGDTSGRNYGAGIVAALLGLAAEQRTASMIALEQLKSMPAPQGEVALNRLSIALATIEARMT